MVIEVPSEKIARRVERYYDALDDLESRDGEWAEATDAQRGAAAAAACRKGRELADRPSAVPRDFDTVPSDPRRVGRTSADVGGVVGPLASLACGVALFGMLWAYNAGSDDADAYVAAVAGGPPALRGYLLDSGHSRHRDEAKRLIAAAYDGPAQRLRAATPGTDPALRAGMVRLVESLREADQGVLSIAVRDIGGPGRPRSEAAEREIADSLARSVGPQLLAFVQSPPDAPAHVDIAYQTAEAEGRVDLSVDVVLRDDIAAGPVVTATVRTQLPGPNDQGAIRSRIRDVVCLELAGGTTAAPPPPPPQPVGGDFE